MAKKKSRPGFNLPSTDRKKPAAPAASEWVYRSDEAAAGQAPAAEPVRAEVVEPPAAMVPAPKQVPAVRTAAKGADGAREIVGNYTMLAAGAGLVPLPLIDMLAIGGLQLKMIAALSEHYQVPFNHDLGKAVLFSVTGGVFSTRFAYGVGGSLLKVIPVIGPMVSSFAMPGFGAALTFAVGSVFVSHFESGGTLLSANALKMRAHLDHKMKHAS